MYLGGLANLVGSLHYWMPGTKIAVFNLGLQADELQEVASWRDCVLHWRETGPPPDLCIDGQWKPAPHLRHLQKYAWKPPAIVEAVEAYGAVLWLDAGCDVRGRLDGVARALSRDGYFLVKGQDLDMTARLQPDCASRLGLRAADFAGKPSFAGGVQGYVRGSAAAGQILRPLYAAAADESCIAPAGSSLQNHRYDQSLLSLIAYSCGLRLKEHTKLLSASRAELSTDPRKPSKRRIYTARCSSVEYIRYLERN